MAYVITPLAGQKVKNTQAPIQQNFVEINNLVAVDHATFGDVNEGKHNKVTLPDQGVAPAFAAGEVGLFGRVPTAPFVQTGVNEMFLRRSDGNTIPFSAATFGLPGWTYLPSGILIKWGNATINGAGTVVFPVGANIAAFSTPPFSIFFTPVTAAGIDPNSFVSLDLTGLSALSFRVVCSNRVTTTATNVPFLYVAIGA